MSFPLTCHIHPTLVGFLFLAATFPLSAQQLAPGPTPAPPQAEPSHRSRIGLALSGGGALGLTEIGVLKWFDEHHIPVDRIAGTSMGGIIAAMYASGMSAIEIENFAEQVDWDQTLLPEPTFTHLAYRRKQDRRNYQISAALGLKHGLNGPNGFNPGHGVGLLLDPSLMEQARRAAGKFQIELNAAADRVLAKIFSRRRVN